MRAVQLVQDRGLPAREHAGPHRAHVGEGEQIEHAQPLRDRPTVGREVGDRLGVVDVAALGDVRHRQVVGHQELHLRRRPRAASPMRAVSASDQRDALGHVAVALAPCRCRAAACRASAAPGFSTSLNTWAAPSDSADWPGRQRLQVLDGEQRVLVGGELVVDVVLHQAGQRAELRQVAAEQPQLVHLATASARPGPTLRQMSRKRSRTVGRAPEGVVDQVERVLDGALEVERRARSRAGAGARTPS